MYGPKINVKKIIDPICHPTEKDGKNKLNDTQTVTNNATPSAYATYIAP